MVLNKQKFFIAVIIGSIFSSFGLHAVYAIDNQYSNQLLKVNVEKDTLDKKITVTLYSSKPYSIKLDPRHMPNNEYVILLPETYHSITAKPSVSGNDGSIKDVDVRLIPYMGSNINNGYTKIIIKTTDESMNFSVNNKVAPINNNIDDDLSSIINNKPVVAVKKVKTAVLNSDKNKTTEQITKPVSIVNKIDKTETAKTKINLLTKNPTELTNTKSKPLSVVLSDKTSDNSSLLMTKKEIVKPETEKVLAKVNTKTIETPNIPVLVVQNKTNKAQPNAVIENKIENKTVDSNLIKPVSKVTDTANPVKNLLISLVIGVGLLLSILFVAINKIRLNLKDKKEHLAKKHKAVKEERKQTSEQILSRLSQSKSVICNKNACSIVEKTLDPVSSFSQKENHALYERFHDDFSENEISEKDCNLMEQTDCNFYEVENSFIVDKEMPHEREISDLSNLKYEEESTVKQENSVILALENLISSLQINEEYIDLLEEIVKNNTRYKNNEDLLEMFVFRTLDKGQNLFLNISDKLTLKIYLNKIAKSAILETLKEYKRI